MARAVHRAHWAGQRLELRLCASAAVVRRYNAKIDEDLLALAHRVPESSLHDEFSDRPRTLAQQLGHLAEFPIFFGAQLEAWLDRRRVVVGRTAGEADLNDALTRATELRLAPLLAWLEGALKKFDGTLGRLHDEHLRAVTHNVEFGREPLTSYLDRYIVAHKLAHAGELEATLNEL